MAIIICCSSRIAAVFCYVVKQTQDVVRLHRNILHSAHIGKPNVTSININTMADIERNIQNKFRGVSTKTLKVS